MVMINFQARIKKNKNVKRRSSWRSRGQAARILAPLLKRKAGNLGLIRIRTLLGQPKRSLPLIRKFNRLCKRRRK